MQSHALDRPKLASGYNYEALVNSIESLGDPSASKKSNLQFVRSLGDPDTILPLLREFMSDSNLLQMIAKRSYRHVNHFDKVVLVDSQKPNGYRLTLHIWNPPFSEKECQDELIHDHRFSFWSTILVGHLKTQEFFVDQDTDDFNSYQYTPENSNSENFYKFRGRYGLKKARRLEEKAGGVYYLSYDTTHRVELPEKALTCTLVLRSPRERNFSNVYNTNYPTTDASLSNRMFEPNEMFGHFSCLYTKIEENRCDRRIEERSLFSVPKEN